MFLLNLQSLPTLHEATRAEARWLPHSFHPLPPPETWRGRGRGHEEGAPKAGGHVLPSPLPQNRSLFQAGRPQRSPPGYRRRDNGVRGASREQGTGAIAPQPPPAAAAAPAPASAPWPPPAAMAGAGPGPGPGPGTIAWVPGLRAP